MDTIDCILKLIESSGKTPYKVAKDCGLDKAAFSHWKSGKQRPNIDTLVKIADYFGVSVDYLVGRETPAEASTISTQNQSSTVSDATTGPLLDMFKQMDEIQQAKLLAYARGMIESDISKMGVVTKK